ncbi:DUF6503 family protein [Maribacter hydrothermalis]|uniref:Outer membrane lipoprotein-sorting protein n=1 Tax=Maribacter hydrothermalis TaxID=1836467 RepID=A0A1B7Z138_9FLAO|nr:DUF6503 family protein [Maribacter hydrothermalis]APQ18063.1 hypothetical protein BTR34_12320 [Maribacter hydrothermalis]OBR36408.1 hypothetical protein A9200_08210 [Maribacter hydrothermalis]
MRLHYKVSLLVIVTFFISCKETPKPDNDVSKEIAPETDVISIPDSWVTSRVAKAKERLNATEAGKIIWNAMEAHGGLAKWYANGPISFRFNYQPLDDKTTRDSYQTVDTWSNRAVHTSATDSTDKFGWTGEKAWVKANDSTAFAYDTKFWALTPLWFVGHPFILNGEGVNLELLDSEIYKEKEYHVVKVTFDAETGDAPDDYYILYVNKETNKLAVMRYIVSYPEYFKDGEHAPEKFTEFIGEQVVDGITMPGGFKTYWTVKENQPGEYITKIDFTNVAFKTDLPKDFFDAPANAKILN